MADMIDYIKKNIKELVSKQDKLNKITKVSERYYQNENDITTSAYDLEQNKAKTETRAALRVADNRVSNNFHFILTNQEASYAFTRPPSFDVIKEGTKPTDKDNEKANKKVQESLGNTDDFSKQSKDLCIDAINAGKGWLHVWIDEDTKKFQYANVNPKQVIPIYDESLKKKLIALIYKYRSIKDGEMVDIFEIWDDDKMLRFIAKKQENGTYDFTAVNDFKIVDNTSGQTVQETNEYQNTFSKIPFIEFRNNNIEQPNLMQYKKHIDIYDKIYSGFVNDIDDFQEIILILHNYSGEGDDFLKKLKAHKTLKVDSVDGVAGGVETLSIEIPIEARNTLLELTKERIYESGQGVNPHQEVSTAASGVALKQIYSMLELKVGLLETEFKIGYSNLLGFILEFHGYNREDWSLKQKWHRTRIDNDLEKADIIQKTAKVSSQETISKYNPMVEDYQLELDQLKQEKEDDANSIDSYKLDSKDPVDAAADIKKKKLQDEIDKEDA